MAATIGASAVVLDHDRVLLIRREDFEIWCLPGGRIDDGETPTDAAVREVREESGYDIELHGLIGVYTNLGGPADNHSLVFAATATAGPFDITTPEEVIDVDWFPVDQLPTPMQWWHTPRIADAVAGHRGLARSVKTTSRSGRLTRAELYAARDASGLTRAEFFAWNFPRPTTDFQSARLRPQGDRPSQ